jgi:competence protein ComEC
MKYFKKYLPYILIFSLFLVGLVTIFLLYTHKDKYIMKVVFLDVGQGDAIYIEAPNGRQVLIDGGPDAKLLSSLAQVMPFADRSLDMIIATHPDSDHIGGFPLLLDNYKVTSILENGATSTSAIYASLEDKISKDKVNKIIARSGMRIILDDKKNIYLDIIFPDRDVSNMESNDGSIVSRLVYGNDSFMFTGDASAYTENLIEWNEQNSTLHSEVLKLAHHGARTSSSLLWLEKVSPSVAIISAGKNNKYGHPHQETLDKLFSLHIPFLSTIDKGNIIFKSDGVKLSY